MTHETAQTREALVEVMKIAAEKGEARYYETTPPDFADDDIKRGMIVDAQIAALEAAGVRLVPVEATEGMKAALMAKSALNAMRCKLAWDYMLSASPYAKDKP